MPFQPVLLWSDAVLWLLVGLLATLAVVSRRAPPLAAAWRKVGTSRVGMAAATLLAVFALIGLADSLHYRLALPAEPGKPAAYGVEVLSVLDGALSGLRGRNEKTYSAPLATQSYAMETAILANGGQQRDFPPLRYGGAQLKPGDSWMADVTMRGISGVVAGGLLWWLISTVLLWNARRGAAPGDAIAQIEPWRGVRTIFMKRPPGSFAWDAVLATLLVVCLIAGKLTALSAGYHVFGTDKVGQDVLYQVLKSVRTALVIGLVTTLVTLPLGILLGIAAGYFGGWIDDVIQYLYTVLNSIPGVLLIAAAVLMMQVVIDTHPEWFATAAERADLRLLALCFILGVTSWTGLARLLRGEALKLRELDYVQAAQAFGVAPFTILLRHILPNVLHIVIITLVMDFSGLVLSEAVLSYVGIGVDPTTISFGTMINNARMELAREPVVWWSLVAAFAFMFALVLAANLFADAVQAAFDPRRSAQ